MITSSTRLCKRLMNGLLKLWRKWEVDWFCQCAWLILQKNREWGLSAAHPKVFFSKRRLEACSHRHD